MTSVYHNLYMKKSKGYPKVIDLGSILKLCMRKKVIIF